MITNDFFKGYFQALNIVNDVVKNVKKEYKQPETIEALESIEIAIKGIKASYQDLIVKLNREINENK